MVPVVKWELHFNVAMGAPLQKRIRPLILRAALYSGSLNEQFPRLILIIIVGGGLKK